MDTQIRELEVVPTPLINEPLFGADWMSLQFSPTRFGIGLPGGNWEPVILVHGFLCHQLHVLSLRLWIYWIGYEVFGPGIGWNTQCLDFLAEQLTEATHKAFIKTGRKVSLICHSLGGLLGRETARNLPEEVAAVICMGTPISGVRVNRVVGEAASLIRQDIARRGNRPEGCYGGGCDCRFMKNLSQDLPKGIVKASIYTQMDGIVDWCSCIDDAPSARNIQVPALSHYGLIFNPDARSEIAHLLSEAYGKTKTA